MQQYVKHPITPTKVRNSTYGATYSDIFLNAGYYNQDIKIMFQHCVYLLIRKVSAIIIVLPVKHSLN